MATRRDHNYVITTDTLVDGRVRAKARGRKTNVKTFPAGTTHEAAATELATKISGERFSHVSHRNGAEGYWADYWSIYVGEPERVEGYIGTVRGSGRIEYFTTEAIAALWSDDANPCVVPNGADVIDSRP